MTITAKRGRLIWKEYIGTLGTECIDPTVSFDRGKTWMSLINQASNLRLGNSVDGCNIRDKGNGFKELDISFGFTPYSNSMIVDHDVEADATDGLAAGTYYFAVSCLYYDAPGKEAVSTNNYYTGPNTVPISKLYKVVLAAQSNIHLYINYPDNVSGLCIYYGTSTGATVDLKLYSVTNFVQKLNTAIANDTTTDPIELLNIYPLPKIGRVKIENEYISYTDCVWNVDHWELTGISRGVNNSTAAAHTFSPAENLPVYYAEYDGGNYGELPEKVYPKPEIPVNLEQYLSFDSESLLDLTGDITRTPSITGTLDYADTATVFNTSLRLTGIGVLDPDITLENTAGTIHTYLRFYEFIQGETTDPYIFGDELGLWMKISRFNLKPYFGYSNITIVSYEDRRIPSLYKDDFSEIGLSWEKDVVTENMTFYLSINGFNTLTVETDIPFSGFSAGTPTIGGLISGSEVTNTFIGFLDDWRVYSDTLTYSDFKDINDNILANKNIYTGKVKVDTNYFDLSTTSNADIQSYEPVIYKQFDTLSTTPGVAGNDYGVFYDNWAIEAYYSDGAVPSSDNITYPINPESLQFKFIMNDNGEGTGFNSPIIKDISIIISEMSLS